MTHPFPETVTVPQGLVRTRLVCGLPPLALLALAGLTVAPIALLGTWWLTPCTALLGLYIAYEARRDPQFLLTWAGELRFKARYH
jgi:type IV secretory pathway TrbD component